MIKITKKKTVENTKSSNLFIDTQIDDLEDAFIELKFKIDKFLLKLRKKQTELSRMESTSG